METEADRLIAGLTGRSESADHAVIDAIVARADDGVVEALGQALSEAHWPQCNALAMALARVGGTGARSALTKALQAKRHHVRTAAIHALVRMSDPQVVPDLERRLSDTAYETRMAAKEGILRLTGREVRTARGE